MPHEDLTWADLSASDDRPLVEWLETASCDPHVKALVVWAVHAADHGVDAARWRQEVLAEHPSASAMLEEAEECMHGSGLWPWHG